MSISRSEVGFLTALKPYAIISLDLTSARADGAQGAVTVLGAPVSNWKANTITILDLGGGTLDFKLDDSTAGLVPAQDGLTISGVPFTEIYWTNAAQVGVTVTIFVAWID
jgi:uncharacterized membrane protein